MIYFQRETTMGLFSEKTMELEVPHVNTVYKGDDSLHHLGPLIWQIVPTHLKKSFSLKEFKEGIKNWIPRQCPCRLCKEFVPGLGYLI